MKFVAYPKIPQFSGVVRAIRMASDFKGLDENGEAIYEMGLYPKVTFNGSVKLHGTNAGVCFAPGEGISPQKRSCIMENPTGHFNFCTWVEAHRTELLNLLSDMHASLGLSDDVQLTMFGEWAGAGVQKSVAISELPKGFYMFDIRSFDRVTEEYKWLEYQPVRSTFFKNIEEFPTYTVEVDFNDPSGAQNEFVDITNKIEDECPVAKALGESGLGEGAVWKTEYKGQRYIFKVKGEKHSISKVSSLAQVDPEIVKNTNDFVEYACTENRIMQGIVEVNATERKDMGPLMKWISNDIVTEEAATLEASHLEWKNVASQIARKVKDVYFKHIEKV